jgi:indole-3-glycerol phosphate synthase
MDKLEEILLRKKEEVKTIDVKYQKRKNPHTFLKNLRQEGMSVIAEIKRRSPSKGDINNNLDPLALAKEYEKGGAAAISVLTDYEGFGGTLEDLKVVKKGVQTPILRKDFIVDLKQISEAIAVGADAILLIVKALKERTKEFVDAANEQGIDALVEVLDEEEIQIAIDAQAKIIGVNNRDLKTFSVDLTRSEKLVSLLPKDCIKIAESGVETLADAKRFYDVGYDGVLIGESLVKAPSPAQMIKEIHDIR